MIETIQPKDEKQCRTCKLPKPLEAFCKFKREKDGRNTQCRSCAKEQQRLCMSNPENKRRALARGARYRSRPEYQEKRFQYNRDHRIRDLRTQYDRNRLYGLTAELIGQMLTSQHYACAICLIPFANGKFHVDHDHLTNRVRSFLCGHCNSAIGYSKENTDTLLRMIQYIEKHKEESLCSKQ